MRISYKPFQKLRKEFCYDIEHLENREKQKKQNIRLLLGPNTDPQNPDPRNQRRQGGAGELHTKSRNYLPSSHSLWDNVCHQEDTLAGLAKPTRAGEARAGRPGSPPSLVGEQGKGLCRVLWGLHV